MAYYKPEEIQKAKEMDLYTYLKNYDPDELVHFSRDTYMTKTHDSLKISNGMWYWFSRGIGGKSALDYLIQVKGYSFMDAMQTILNAAENIPSNTYNRSPKKKEVKFIMPEKAENNNHAINYLIRRGINKEIIEECVDNDIIFEEKNTKNVVFVGYDLNNEPRYAMCRGTSFSRFVNEVYGSHKAFSFNIESKEESKNLHLFESAIDLLSYLTLLKDLKRDWYKDNYLSLAGVYCNDKNKEYKTPIALVYFLFMHPKIENIIIHFDNDYIGKNASKMIKNKLSNKYKVINNPPPFGKDVNEYLLLKKRKKDKER